MKTKTLTALLIFTVCSSQLFAASDTDQKIKDTAEDSYNLRVVLEKHVAVKSEDGIVTLTGTVEDKDQSDLAKDTLTNLPGVKSVKNDIVIKSSYSDNSDAWMAFKIRSHLLVQSSVSAVDTSVSVENGVVTLTGTAKNLAQKELTEAYATDIDGVKSVNNELVLTETIALLEVIDDASVTSQVKRALRLNKATSDLKLEISTAEGVVKVTGIAASDAQKALVSKLAMDIKGTQSVTNEMTIKS